MGAAQGTLVSVAASAVAPPSGSPVDGSAHAAMASTSVATRAPASAGAVSVAAARSRRGPRRGSDRSGSPIVARRQHGAETARVVQVVLDAQQQCVAGVVVAEHDGLVAGVVHDRAHVDREAERAWRDSAALVVPPVRTWV